MSRRVDLLSGADADLQEQFNRFEDYREGFGIEFMSTVEAYLTRLAIFPESAPIYRGSIRRQVMQKFPLGIFYEVHPTRIVILAILDLRQDEQNILRRLGLS